MTTVAQPSSRGYRTLRLPIEETNYERFLSDRDYARSVLDALYDQHPELFPDRWSLGYAWCGFTEQSKKQSLRYRRVRLGADKTVWMVSPIFVMPYGSARTKEPAANPDAVNCASGI